MYRISQIAGKKWKRLVDEHPPRYRDIRGAFNIKYHAPCDIGTSSHMVRIFGPLAPISHGACNSEFGTWCVKMGVLYIIVPLDDSITGYLRDIGVPFSDSGIPSRNPTPNELREAAASLADQRVTFYTPPTHAWQIMIEGQHDPEHEPWTLLNVTDFSGDEDRPHSFWFEKGWPSLILRVVHALSTRCGSLVIVPDTGCKPIVVAADDDPEVLFDAWEHTNGVDQ